MASSPLEKYTLFSIILSINIISYIIYYSLKKIIKEIIKKENLIKIIENNIYIILISIN